jgi:hypothetical protein
LQKRLEQFFGIPASELLAESGEPQLIAKFFNSVVNVYQKIVTQKQEKVTA